MYRAFLVKVASVLLAGAMWASVGMAQEKPAHFAEGQFQKTYSDGMPVGWNIPAWLKSGFTLQQEGGKPFLRLAWPHVGHATIECRIVTEPDWAQVTLDMRVRLKELKTANKPGAFEFRHSFRNANDEIVGGHTGLRVDQPTDWTNLKATVDVPADATSLLLNPGFYEATGTVDIASIDIIVKRKDGSAVETLRVVPPASAPKDEAREPAPAPPAPVAAAPLPPAVKVAPDATWGKEPVEALTPARGRIVLSGLWNFMPASAAAADSSWGMIRVPGSWKPFREERGPAMPGVTRTGSGPAWAGVDFHALSRAWYSRTVQIPEAWRGRAIQLELTRLSTDAIVYANGKECGRIGEGFGAVDLTDAVEPGKEATLAIFVMAGVEAREVTQKMGVGVGHETKIKVTLPMAGINGDAVLHSRPQGAHVSDVFVKPSTRQKKLTLDIELASVPQAGPVALTAELLDERGKVEKTFTGTVQAKAADVQRVEIAFNWDNPRLWDLDQPNLYTLRLGVKGQGLQDSYWQPFGFREFWIEGRKFMLNGSEFRLRTYLINGGDGAGVPEVIDSRLEGMRRVGFNFIEMWPADDILGAGQEYTARRADLKGIPISGMALHTIAANKKWRDPAARAEYQRSMERVMRRFRNHPSIMMWGTTANWIGHEQDQNPRLIGTQAFAEQNTGEVTRTAAREQVAMMRKADPTRPIFFHHGTNIADFSTVNTYLNVIPLQEREEWLSEWARRQDSQPWWAVEFGLPLDITLMRGRSNDVSVYVERLFTENMATYLGHDAYLRETDLMWHLNRNDFDDPAGENFRKSGQPRDVWPVGGYQHWFITRDKMGGLDFAYAPYQDYMTLFVRNTYRSWRTWGSTSLPMPWGFPARMKFAGDKDAMVKLPAFQPGRIGTWVPEVPQQAFWTVEGKQAEEAPITRAMREANSETLAWITGPAEAFTAKDHNFWAGSNLQKQIALLNDTRAPQRYKLRWTARVGQQMVGSKTAEGQLKVADTRFVPITAALPAVGTGKVDGTIEVEATIGDRRHTDKFAFRVFARPAAAKGAVQVLDPDGKTTRMLKSLGFTTRPWDGKSTAGLVIVGRDVLAKGHPLPGELKTLLANGGRCLVMAQQPEWHESALGLRVARHLSRRVFPVDSRHPVTSGLDEQDLRDWTGQSTLVEAYPDYGTENHLPPYGWRWGNRGALTSGAIEKPHLSGWRPILEAEFDLAYTPLMELDYGKGRLVWCALDLEDYVPTDPAAVLLAGRIVEYAAKAPLSPRASSVAYLGDAAGASQLEAIGVAFNKSTQLPAPDGLAVIGAGASVDDAALQRFVEQGGRVLVLTQEGERGRLGVTLKKTAEAGRGTRPPAWPEARGLSVSDLHSRAPLTGWVIDGGAENGFGGLIGRKVMGKGVAVFAQIAPDRLDVKSEPYLRFTRWRQTRALSQLLANLGASFTVDGAMPGLRSVADSVALSGEWRMKALKLVPGSKDINNKTPFEPISAQAKALVGVDVKDENWERVKVPGIWPLLDEQDGELVARRQVTIPAEWAGKDLTLSLGAVDDFDTTFWNGEKIGEGEGWNKPRTYTVPGRLVKAGANVLSVRVFDWYMGGGFGAKSPAELFVRPADSDASKSRGYYHPDYIVDFVVGDDPYRYWRW